MSQRSLELVVVAIDQQTPAIRTVTLAASDGARLPSFPPGSHVVVDIPARAGRGRAGANAYSLVGDGVEPQTYAISVLRCDPAEGGSGGSVWIHELTVGDRVTASGPRSAFAPLQRAGKHLLIAAGIGVTPMLSHLRSAVRWGRDAELVYVFRDGHGAHVDELKDIGGDRVTFAHERATFAEHLEGLVSAQPLGTHLYVCGPGQFMDFVLDAARAAGWPESRLHSESFGLADLDPGDPFTVAVGERELAVASGVSLLEALEQAGYGVASLCRQGVCGECRVQVVPATSTGILHRDLYLTDDDKRSGDCVMACVSRALPDPTGRAHLEVIV